jgi:hypothetical protein
MGQFALKAKTVGDRVYKGCLVGKIKESFNKKTDLQTI